MGGFYIGTSGEKGDKGDKGDPGERGTRWFYGSGPPLSIPDSVEGDYYIDTETGQIYELRWS